MGAIARRIGLLACGSLQSGCLPKAIASVAASRLLPTHSCATAPVLNRLPLIRELFGCAVHYGAARDGRRHCLDLLLAFGYSCLVEGGHLVEGPYRGFEQRKR